MDYETRAIHSYELNGGLKFRKQCRIRQAPEEGRREQQLKCCDYKKQAEGNNSNKPA